MGDMNYNKELYKFTQTYLIVIILFSSLAGATITDPGHPASDIGGTTISDRTFQAQDFKFQNNLGIGIDPITKLHSDGTIRMSTGGVSKLDISDGGSYNQLYSYSGLDLNLNGAGNVGINANAPDGKLVINGSATSSPSSNAALKITGVGTGSTMTMGLGYNFADAWIQSNGAMIVHPEAGNVGIGTTSPQSQLHITSNAGIVNLEGADHTFIQWYPDTYASGRKAYTGYPGASIDDFTIANEIAGKNIEFLLNSGNLGINTNQPDAPLDVAGGTAATGTIAGDYGKITTSRDEWLRLNDAGGGDQHTSGTYLDGTMVGTQGGFCVGCFTDPGTGDMDVAGGDVQINNVGSWSTIIFPASSNDRGYIAHTEVANTGELRFAVSDDVSGDYFSYGVETGSAGPGTGTWTERARMSGQGNLQVDGVVTANDFSCSNCLGAADIADGLGTAEINEAVIQQRVTGTCGTESSIRIVAQGGTVTCEADSYQFSTAFSAYRSGSIAKSSSWQKVPFNVDSGTYNFDDGGNFDTTNSRFTAPATGAYYFTTGVTLSSIPLGNRYVVAFKVNNAGQPYPYVDSGYFTTTAYDTVGGSAHLYLNANDYVEVFMYTASAGTYYGSRYYTWFTGHRVS